MSFRPARGRGDTAGPAFNLSVCPDGYAWWYLDGLSDCGKRGISVIGFIGSVFSPYYSWSGRKDPMNHCSINVALYGLGGKRWAMTERGRNDVDRSASHFAVGPSQITWDGNCYVVDVSEVAVPHLTHLRGQIRLWPEAITDIEVPLYKEDRHIWRPFAPAARVEVDFQNPAWQWNGHGYLDANFGTHAMEADFRYWTWARVPTRQGAATLYDVDCRDGDTVQVALAFDKQGKATPFEAPPKTNLPRTIWAIRRETRATEGYRPRQVQHMLEAPFYSRSAIRTHLMGEETTGVHEALDLDRFANRFIQCMLPVRMPRALHRSRK